jgi:hypothetical protein
MSRTFQPWRKLAALGRVLLLATGLPATALAQVPLGGLADRDIVEAYHYILGRLLILRQENLDLREGFKWNQIIHREPGGVAWANPNLDVVYSEAWVAVDETSCTVIELPKIEHRYYTVQLLNGWGETTANINERNYKKIPFGRFALCLKGAKVTFPPKTKQQRVDLPDRKARLLARIELGSDPKEAVRLQKLITMRPTGAPKVAAAVIAPEFPNDKLPGVEAFDKSDAVLASEPDINKGMIAVQERVATITKAIADPAERKRIDDVIRKRAIPEFFRQMDRLGTTKSGWSRPNVVGNYRSDYLTRSIINLGGIWANNTKEVVYFKTHVDGRGRALDGNATYTMTFPADHLPPGEARYFWSVIAVDGQKFQVIDNPLKRHLINKQSGVQTNEDGSLTLAFANAQPAGVPQQNWLPTPATGNYHLTFRFYGPGKDASAGKYFPPPLVRK